MQFLQFRILHCLTPLSSSFHLLPIGPVKPYSHKFKIQRACFLKLHFLRAVTYCSCMKYGDGNVFSLSIHRRESPSHNAMQPLLWQQESHLDWANWKWPPPPTLTVTYGAFAINFQTAISCFKWFNDSTFAFAIAQYKSTLITSFLGTILRKLLGEGIDSWGDCRCHYGNHFIIHWLLHRAIIHEINQLSLLLVLNL